MRYWRRAVRQQLQLLHAVVTAVWLLASCAPLPQQREVEAQLPTARQSLQLTGAEAATIAFADKATTRAPHALRIVSTAGRLSSDRVAQVSHAARMDWYAMLALAQAANITGDRRYGNALETYFAAWVAIYEPQAQPIDETHFHQIVLAYEAGAQYLSVPTQVQTIKLFRRMVSVLFDSKHIQPGTDKNNWQSHRVKLATVLAFVLQEPVLIEVSRAAFRKQVAGNINADGMVLDFRERDALHYVIYSLEPLLTAALIAQQHGENWYSFKASSGASLAAALQWLAPYADGEKAHLEFQNTRIPFDRQRAQTGVPGFLGVWNPADAVTCYQLAARLDAKWIARAVRLGSAPSWVELAYPSPLIAAAQAGLSSTVTQGATPEP